MAPERAKTNHVSDNVGVAKPSSTDAAPDEIRKRAREWGPGGVDARFSAAWAGFAPKLEQWLDVIDSRGPAAVQQVYLDTLNGRIPPEQGHMLSPGD